MNEYQWVIYHLLRREFPQLTTRVNVEEEGGLLSITLYDEIDEFSRTWRVGQEIMSGHTAATEVLVDIIFQWDFQVEFPRRMRKLSLAAEKLAWKMKHIPIPHAGILLRGISG